MWVGYSTFGFSFLTVDIKAVNSDQSAHPVVSHFFRHEYGKLIAILTKTFGTRNLELIEDVVQDTLLKALENWKLKGVPENPTAWLLTSARNKAVDVLRKNKQHQALAANQLKEYSSPTLFQQLIIDHTIEDEQLRMMFVCCHPSIAEEGQVALTLKTLCGFSVAEIANAFLTNEETITKRLFRARSTFREENVEFTIPTGAELNNRLENVLTAIYLLFNEGYHASQNDSLIRDDLVEEALRLGNFLRSNPATNKPITSALLALMCFQAARIYGRLDASGNILQLKEQDRSVWNRELIRQGHDFLNMAAQGERISAYHLEAFIAYEHCIAPSYAQTNWKKIDELYELLKKVKPLPLIAFQHAIIKTELYGAAEGLKELTRIETAPELMKHHFLFNAKGEWLNAINKKEEAMQNFERAFSLADTAVEKEFIQRKINELRQQ
jgi:RNA polymerase sigma factor (sigma-70 family)